MNARISARVNRSGWSPAEEFDLVVRGLVTHHAPRVFAVVEEFGTRQDARIAAWGMAHDTRTDVVGVDVGYVLAAGSPESAAVILGHGTDLATRVVWVDPTDEPEH